MTDSQQQLSLQRIYLKDVSFEAPSTPDIFKEAWQPEVNVNLNVRNNLIEPNYYEVVLAITVTVTQQQKTVYLLEVQQAGLFFIQGLEGDLLNRLLATYCPTILFPYVREVISDLVGKGSFPQFLLAPVNFDALFEEASKQKAEK